LQFSFKSLELENIVYTFRNLVYLAHKIKVWAARCQLMPSPSKSKTAYILLTMHLPNASDIRCPVDLR